MNRNSSLSTAVLTSVAAARPTYATAIDITRAIVRRCQGGDDPASVQRARGQPQPVLRTPNIEKYAAIGVDPEQVFFVRELEQLVAREMEQLSETLRAAFTLVKIEGMSCAEAGVRLGVKTDAIKQRVHRASEALRVALRDW